MVGVAAETAELGIRLANFFNDINKPKVKKLSPKLNEITKIVITDEFDENHRFLKRSDYATVWDDGQKKTVMVKDIPKNRLNIKSAVDRAMTGNNTGIY